MTGGVDLIAVLQAVMAGGGINTLVLIWLILQVVSLQREFAVIKNDVTWMRDKLAIMAIAARRGATEAEHAD